MHCRLNHSIDEYYGAETRDRTAWIEHARRCLEISTWKKRDSLTEKEALDRLRYVKDRWINEQKGYFSKAVDGGGKAGGLRQKVTILRNATYAIYAAAVIILTSLAWFYLVEWVVSFWPLAGAMFALLGFVAKWFEVHGYEEDLNRYSDTLDLFRRAEYELTHWLSKRDVERANKVVRETAIHALAENESWYLTHSEKREWS